MQTLHTQRLCLRPLDTSDENFYCGLYVDPFLMQHIAAPLDLDTARHRFGIAIRQQSARRQHRLIIEMESTTAIGLVALFVDGSSAEMGVMLVATAHGRGYATEAMAAVRDHAFAGEGLDLLWIRQQPANHAVTPMMRKLGFEPLPMVDEGTGFRRWELDRQRWLSLHAGAVAADQPNR